MVPAGGEAGVVSARRLAARGTAGCDSAPSLTHFVRVKRPENCSTRIARAGEQSDCCACLWRSHCPQHSQAGCLHIMATRTRRGVRKEMFCARPHPGGCARRSLTADVETSADGRPPGCALSGSSTPSESDPVGRGAVFNERQTPPVQEKCGSSSRVCCLATCTVSV